MYEETQFTTVDFVVFLGMLLTSLGIGVYYAIKDRKKNSIENYYFGGRSMSPIPVGLSISVTFVSSITVLAFPAHAYVYGTVVIWFGLNVYLQIIVACVYYIPLYHRLKLSSVYEYLELRYSRAVRLVASSLIVFLMVTYMATTIYLTSLSLSAVTPISMTLSIILTAGICTIYTTLGGMKAVVWSDALQAGIMVIGILSVMIKATIAVGGFENVWKAVSRGRRNTFLTFDPDPTLKHSFWSIMIGGALRWTCSMCTNQAIVQRYQSCKTVRDARVASIIGAVPMVLMKVVSVITGCVMYAYFEGCDPVKDGKIQKVDQTVTYLAVKLFQEMPGMAGLFVAAAYSGMLSTVSSGINSLAALVLEDFIIPQRPNMQSNMRLSFSKGLSVIFGVLTTAMVFIVKEMSGTSLQIVLTFFGSFGGPILGIFAIGMHFPWTNSLGAVCGLITGVSFGLWIALGGIFHPHQDRGVLPFSTKNCSSITSTTSGGVFVLSQNMTTLTTMTSITEGQRSIILEKLYSVSYMYIATLGMAMAIITAGLVSIITGKNNPKDLDPKLFIPLLDNRIFPESIRKIFRFGVDEYQPEFPDNNERNLSLLNDNIVMEKQKAKQDYSGNNY